MLQWKIMKNAAADKKIYLFLFIIAFFMVFTSAYSPFDFRRPHVDSSIYVTIGRGAAEGAVPYRDFADNKGPVLYLLIAAGWKLGGFAGIWFMELILMCVSVFFAYKTALFFGGGKKALFAAAFSFIAELNAFYVNAGAEEFALPFIMISFYIFTKYFIVPDKNGGIKFSGAAALGTSFACAVLIRLNMFPFWAGFCAVIFIELLVKRRYALLLKYIMGFSAGIIAVCVPLYLYLKLNSALGDFFIQVLDAGAAKGFSSGGLKETIKNFFSVINWNSSSIPLFCGVFWVIGRIKTGVRAQNNIYFYSAYIFSYILFVLFRAFSDNAGHFNMALIPYFIPALVFLSRIIYPALAAIKNIKLKKAAFVLFFCVIFAESLFRYVNDLGKIVVDKSGAALVHAGKMIDINTNRNDKIISLGINGYIYPFTQRAAASKYCYQGSGLYLIPGSMEEFINDILTGKPKIIAVFTALDGGRYDYLDASYAPVYDLMARDYRLLSDENGYALFIRKE